MLHTSVKAASARGRVLACLQSGANPSHFVVSHVKQLTSLVEWASHRDTAFQQASSAHCQADQSAYQLGLIQHRTMHRSITTFASLCFASKDGLDSESATPSGESPSDKALHPGAGSHAAVDDDLDEEQKVQQIEDTHLAESMERLIMEAYKLMQSGDMQQAESLLLEGTAAHLYHQALT